MGFDTDIHILLEGLNINKKGRDENKPNTILLDTNELRTNRGAAVR